MQITFYDTVFCPRYIVPSSASRRSTLLIHAVHFVQVTMFHPVHCCSTLFIMFRLHCSTYDISHMLHCSSQFIDIPLSTLCSGNIVPLTTYSVSLCRPTNTANSVESRSTDCLWLRGSQGLNRGKGFDEGTSKGILGLFRGPWIIRIDLGLYQGSQKNVKPTNR